MRGLNVVLPFQQPRFERHRLIGRRVSSITVPVQSVPRSLSSVRGRARDLPWVEAICASTLGAVVALYAVVYSSLSIAAYRTGRTLFDLAAFEQSFWNATQGRLFSVSLEVTRPDLVVQMSHFGRHFSPIFFLLLPVYATYQHPSTLLVLQSLALGGAAIPLYLFARERLRSPVAALVIAVLYLASPAVHDVNTVNEFHELSFVIPLVFLAFYAIETERWLLYGVAVAGMLCVKEDVALTVCALGVYVAAVAGRRMLGLATLLSGGAWFVAVTLFVIPAFRGVNGPIPFLGYEYLGTGMVGIISGLIMKPLALWHVVTAAPKIQYVFWLLVPTSFIALLAPEILAVAAPAMLVILASTFPLTYAEYAQYVAPIVPVVFVAMVVGIDRLRGIWQHNGRRCQTASLFVGVLLLSATLGTTYSQIRLHKFPAHVRYSDVPNPTSAAAIDLVQAIPARASVVIEDHRWLAHAANRRVLYFLSDRSPEADYVLINGGSLPPITNVHKEVREAAVQRIITSGNYVAFQCAQGFELYVRKDVIARDKPMLACTLIPSVPARALHGDSDDGNITFSRPSWLVESAL